MGPRHLDALTPPGARAPPVARAALGGKSNCPHRKIFRILQKSDDACVGDFFVDLSGKVHQLCWRKVFNID
jgi:hypothetical protein